MKQIKIFTNNSPTLLEQKVNEFLKTLASNNITDIKITDSEGFYTAVVTYDCYRIKEKDTYEHYQLEWCKQHNITLEDIVAKAINNFAICEETNSTVEDMVGEVIDMIEESGFNGECYVCKSEWENNEAIFQEETMRLYAKESDVIAAIEGAKLELDYQLNETQNDNVYGLCGGYEREINGHIATLKICLGEDSITYLRYKELWEQRKKEYKKSIGEN